MAFYRPAVLSNERRDQNTPSHKTSRVLMVPTLPVYRGQASRRTRPRWTEIQQLVHAKKHSHECFRCGCKAYIHGQHPQPGQRQRLPFLINTLGMQTANATHSCNGSQAVLIMKQHIPPYLVATGWPWKPDNWVSSKPHGSIKTVAMTQPQQGLAQDNTASSHTSRWLARLQPVQRCAELSWGWLGSSCRPSRTACKLLPL